MHACVCGRKRGCGENVMERRERKYEVMNGIDREEKEKREERKRTNPSAAGANKGMHL